MKKYWFRNKRYGWGWYPASWEGWLVMAVWLALFIPIISRAAALKSENDVWLQIEAPVFAITAILSIIAWKTGEKPGWRWGGKPIGKKDETPKQQ